MCNPDCGKRPAGRSTINLTGVSGVMLALALGLPTQAIANGLGESRPWQFRTTADRANLAAVADVVERKKGGYYDGFTTVVYQNSTTNIGTQVNCNNVADATGNIADNAQTGNAPVTDASADLDATADGNAATDGGQVSGDGSAGSSTTQTNSGTVSSGVTGSDVNSSTGAINNGGTDNALDNDQDNSGNQTATISSSEACNMAGSTLNGAVESYVDGALTAGGPLN